MGSFYSKHLSEDGAQIINSEQISVTVMTGAVMNSSLKVLKKGSCMIKEIHPEYPDQWAERRDDMPLTSIYFSQQARLIYMVPSDHFAPQWYDSTNHLQSHYKVKLGHSPGCYALRYEEAVKTAGAQMIMGRPYKAAACIVCQDVDGKFLLTRRERNMGSYPKAWVFPGGHIEIDEGLDEGGLRELYEETGVKVNVTRTPGTNQAIYSYGGHDVTVTPFYAFEATRKYDESDPQQPRPPHASHFVLFLKVRLPVKSTEVHLNLDPKEVEASAWVSEEQAKIILAKPSSQANEEIEQSITIQNRGEQFPGGVTLASLYPTYPNEIGEGIAGAARQVLEELLQDS